MKRKLDWRGPRALARGSYILRMPPDFWATTVPPDIARRIALAAAPGI
jgi:hypothetical protein